MYRLEETNNKKILAIVNSYFGHFIHANSFRLRKTIYERYFKNNFIPKKDYYSLKIAARNK